MPKDLVIGLAANYGWPTIAPFACSLVRSGFQGDRVLFVKNLTDEATENLHQLGFWLEPIPDLVYSNPTLPWAPYFPYVGRFLLIHNFLRAHPGYRFAICSDTRDVVFFRDPAKWLALHSGSSKLVAASEHILHRDQPGNVLWLNQAFKEVEDVLLPRPVYCSGFISGHAEYVRDLAMAVYLGGRDLTSTVWGADQPIYNTIMAQKAYADITLVPTMHEKYCINLVNLATTAERRAMLDTPDCMPFATYGQGFVQNLSLLWNFGIPSLKNFTVLHQYDRIKPMIPILRREFTLERLDQKPLIFEPTEFGD